MNNKITTTTTATTTAPTTIIVPEALEKINGMTKSQVLNELSSLNTWAGLSRYLDGIPSRWKKIPVKRVMKTEIGLANSVNRIKNLMMNQLENCLLKADIKELKNIIKNTSSVFEKSIALKNEATSFEVIYIDKGEYEFEENGEKITIGSNVIFEAISDIKADIVENNKKMEESKAETKALAKILRRKFI